MPTRLSPDRGGPRLLDINTSADAWTILDELALGISLLSPR
jgi:hypothetical protein